MVAVRNATAGLGVAVALFLLLRISLIATFRGALIVLAALELLAFGRLVLSRDAGWREWVTIALKAIVLGGAYLALSG